MDSTDMLQLANHLKGTLSSEVNERRQAENFLKLAERGKYYLPALLELLQNQTLSIEVRMSASIMLKNFVKRNWRVEEDADDPILEEDRIAMKNQLIGAVLSSSGAIQAQLSETIGVIGHEDFPQKWPSLLPDLIERMAQMGANLAMVRGVLYTAHSLFKRYRHECRSNELFSEIKLVIGQFGAPLLHLTRNLMALVVGDQRVLDGPKLVDVFQALLLVFKIFLSLNCQDLPEFFEDTMSEWMLIHCQILQLDPCTTQLVNASASVVSESGIASGFGGSEEAGCLVEHVKSQVCDNIGLYASKYEEEFTPFLSGFVTDVWQMLLTTSQETRFDMLVGNAIEFLSSVVARPQHRHLFESPETLQSLCEKVILPNMHLRDEDLELFEDNPDEYIRHDLEGSNSHTRRRAACSLVHALCEAFEAPVVANFSGYLDHLLAEYASAGPAVASCQKAWVAKDAALLLITSVAGRKKTEKHGVTTTTALVDVPSFFQLHVLPELQNPEIDKLPVLKADCLRYAITFRGLLLADPQRADCLFVLANLMPMFLRSVHPVVHSYAAVLLDKLLTMQVPNGPSTGEFASVPMLPIIRAEHFADPAGVISSLISALKIPTSLENVYLMKALLRICHCLQDSCLSSMSTLMQLLVERLNAVSKNPSKPQFNHFLFETICVCIRVTCAAEPSSITHFEAALFPVFQEIMQNDVAEFIPYVFQLLSVMLEHYPLCNTVEVHLKEIHVRHEQILGLPPCPPAPLAANSQLRPSPPYASLLPRLLVPVLWEQTANIPSLVRLLKSYVLYDGTEVLAMNKLSPLLGVYQRLIASRTFDTHAFSLLASLLLAVPKAGLLPYLKQIFVVIFQRLTQAKTEKFMRGFVGLIANFILIYSPGELISLIDDQIQPALFSKVLEKVLIPFASQVCAIPPSLPVSSNGNLPQSPTNLRLARSNWRLVTTALTRLLTDLPADSQLSPAGGTSAAYVSSWAPLLASLLVGLARGPGDWGLLAIEAAVADEEIKHQNLARGETGASRSAIEERFIEVNLESASQSIYGQLVFACPRLPDLAVGIIDPRTFLARSIQRFSSTIPGKLAPLLTSGLDSNATELIQRFCLANQVQIL